MAKRRRSYRGTPEHHRLSALAALTNVQSNLRQLSSALRAGDCRTARAFAGGAIASNAQYATEIAHAKGAYSEKRRGSVKRMTRLLNAFDKMCVRGF